MHELEQCQPFPFLSVTIKGQIKPQGPAMLEHATWELQAAPASGLRSAPLANASPLEKPERWLLQLLLEMLPPCESHLYSHFRLIVQIWEDLRVSGG